MTVQKGAASGKPASPEREGGWVVWLVVVILLLLAAGAYAGSYHYVGDKVPRGTEISGVDVGGLTRAAAIEALDAEFADRSDKPIEVTVDGSRAKRVRPSEIGMGIDYDATLDAVDAEQSWLPARQWDFYAGIADIDAVVGFDEARLDAKLFELSSGLGTPPKDGRVILRKNGKIRTVAAEAGRAIDPDVARDALAAAYLGADDRAELAVVPLQPEIDEDDVTTAVETLAEPAVAAPVTIVFGESEVKLRPPQIARALRLVPDDGVLALQVKQKKLIRMLDEATTDGEPVDATVRLVDGTPKVVPGKPGVSYESADAVRLFERLVRASGEGRTGTLDAQVSEPEFTAADAKALQIREKVSEFTTYYPHSDYRNINIGRAAELVDGTVLKPGDTFSMNGIVGERTAENGFTAGYIISNGILKKAYGGGVSQLATTLFNAMFFAGLEDVEHKPHSFYIDRYPVGREATVAWPYLDLQFRNDTEYGVLVRAFISPSSYSSQGSVTVQLWSTKVWDIDATQSERYAYVSPKTRYIEDDPDCEPHSGWSGFQIDVTRIFRKHGESAVHHTENFHTVYTPSDSVVCGPPPEKKQDDEQQGDGQQGDDQQTD